MNAIKSGYIPLASLGGGIKFATKPLAFHGACNRETAQGRSTVVAYNMLPPHKAILSKSKLEKYRLLRTLLYLYRIIFLSKRPVLDVPGAARAKFSE